MVLKVEQHVAANQLGFQADPLWRVGTSSFLQPRLHPCGGHFLNQHDIHPLCEKILTLLYRCDIIFTR
jgi:hypothetical protein